MTCHINAYEYILKDVNGCRRTPMGKEYMGTTRVTVSGRQCIHWNNQTYNTGHRDISLVYVLMTELVDQADSYNFNSKRLLLVSFIPRTKRACVSVSRRKPSEFLPEPNA